VFKFCVKISIADTLTYFCTSLKQPESDLFKKIVSYHHKQPIQN